MEGEEAREVVPRAVAAEADAVKNKVVVGAGLVKEEGATEGEAGEERAKELVGRAVAVTAVAAWEG
eukprot:5658268-Prymnesium_polylepis.1